MIHSDIDGDNKCFIITCALNFRKHLRLYRTSLISGPKEMNKSLDKSSQDSEVVNSDTSESSSGEDEEVSGIVKPEVKPYCKLVNDVEKIYSKLEGCTFRGDFDKRVEMEQFRLPEVTSRPVYIVIDGPTNILLNEIYKNMRDLEKRVGGREIWKGITTHGMGSYKLWGTANSVDYSDSGMYHIPAGGVEVIVSDMLMKYQAMVNITVLEYQQ